MKTVICNKGSISVITDTQGRVLSKETVKAPKKGESYRATGEITIKGIVYYLLMGFGIKTAFRADNFQDA